MEKKYVIDEKNNNVTENFEKGAKEVLEFAKKLNIKKLYFKQEVHLVGQEKYIVEILMVN